jgi:hypothetical protein
MAWSDPSHSSFRFPYDLLKEGARGGCEVPKAQGIQSTLQEVKMTENHVSQCNILFLQCNNK